MESFTGQNKEALMKALPKGQYIKRFQYGLGVITESNEQRIGGVPRSHPPKAPNRLYLRKLAEEL